MKYILQFLVLTLLFPHLQVQAATTEDQHITVGIPETVILKSIQQILPLTLDIASDQVEGTITIEKLYSVLLQKQRISAKTLLHGNNMSIKTMVGNQEIRLQLGSASTDFSCDVDLRYDAEEQTLYIRPLPRERETEQSLKKGNIGEALLILLNGREFPIALQDIQPIIAEASNKTITIQTHVADIRSMPQALLLKLTPEISTSQ